MHLFYAVAHIFQFVLFSLGCISSFLKESQGFSIFDRNVFAHFCCGRCRRARFIIVVSFFDRVGARMWESCTKMLVSIAVRMFFIFLCCCPTSFFLFFPSIRCGRCFGSRSPASSSQTPLQPLHPKVYGEHVQPSWADENCKNSSAGLTQESSGMEPWLQHKRQNLQSRGKTKKKDDKTKTMNFSERKESKRKRTMLREITMRGSRQRKIRKVWK